MIKTVVEGVTDGMGSDLFSAIPFDSSIVAIGKAFNNYKNVKYYKNLHAFIYESKEQETFSKKILVKKVMQR